MTENTSKMNDIDYENIMFDLKEMHDVYTGFDMNWCYRNYTLNEQIENYSKSVAFWMEQYEEVQKYEKNGDEKLLFKYNWVNSMYDAIRNEVFERFEYDINTRRKIVSFAKDYKKVRKEMKSLFGF